MFNCDDDGNDNDDNDDDDNEDDDDDDDDNDALLVAGQEPEAQDGQSCCNAPSLHYQASNDDFDAFE